MHDNFMEILFLSLSAVVPLYYHFSTQVQIDHFFLGNKCNSNIPVVNALNVPTELYAN
ncbi:hypothetical protein FWK35_00011068 [Aphis craccivora]|uniref:Uncharacterized protein n=1 Tax=Aphis craccivora TaxID=307492 RepID=A0A6G0ZA59_APHCR|nr:hypothetical protein FWK35_00011068 [Aphis craccivora]